MDYQILLHFGNYMCIQLIREGIFFEISHEYTSIHNLINLKSFSKIIKKREKLENKLKIKNRSSERIEIQSD